MKNGFYCFLGILTCVYKCIFYRIGRKNELDFWYDDELFGLNKLIISIYIGF